MSGLFQQVVFPLGAKQIKCNANHPESQGTLERFHSALKKLLGHIAQTMKKSGMNASTCCLQLGVSGRVIRL